MSVFDAMVEEHSVIKRSRITSSFCERADPRYEENLKEKVSSYISEKAWKSIVSNGILFNRSRFDYVDNPERKFTTWVKEGKNQEAFY